MTTHDTTLFDVDEQGRVYDMSDWEEEEAPQAYSLDQYFSLFQREREYFVSS